MRLNHHRYLWIISGFILVLTSIAFFINSLLFKFPGNNFFPEHTPLIALIIILSYVGLLLLFGKDSRASNSCLELFYLFCVMTLIALATNAVQLTPFPPIDKKILEFETYFNIDLITLMEWTHSYPWFKALLLIIYDTLPYQMSILPICVITTGKFYLLRDYYFLMLLTTLLGFTFYYFFPTTAPASILSSTLFSPEQIATGFKFHQIHQHIIPTTNEGGLIALPSFHTIWAILCVYLLKEWKIPCMLLLVINSLLIASCVLLGWHYPIDILGAFIITGLSYYLLILSKSVDQNPASECDKANNT